MARRNELSKKNSFYLPKHRFLELKHYCLQVPEWEKRIADICLSIGIHHSGMSVGGNGYMGMSIPNWKEICELDALNKKIQDIADVCQAINNDSQGIDGHLYECVTKGLSYEYVQSHYGIPLSRDTWYKNYYRKYFWLLDKKLQQRE